MATLAARTGSAAAFLVASLGLACGPAREDPAPGARESRSAVISDQVHGRGVPGFFWLPPMAPTTSYGEFKAGLAPEVVIERLPLGSAPPVAKFTAAEVRTDGESHYKVNWHTKASTLDPSVTYRIRVVLGGFELGFADVDVVSSGSELRDVPSAYVPLLAGRTLPIKFRIEPGAMLCVDRGPCTAKDACHVAGTCDPFTGICSDPEKPNGTACDDGTLCTRTDTCQAGACTGSNEVVCTASDQCRDAGACDPATGVCSDPPKADGTACDDADLCTRIDACQGGACTGADPVVCTALDQCHDAGVCEPFTGVCPAPEKANGSACDDANLCTRTDTCQAGACSGSSPVVCTASDQCHDAGACDASTGLCSDPAKADGSACSDGTACTRSDTCQGGSCLGTDLVVCTASDQCHDAGACDPGTGACSTPNRLDGTACNDGNFCTASDACAAGACRGAEIACDDADACTQNGCDPGTAGADGVTGCVYVPDHGLPGCQVPPPPATVSIVGLAAATEGFFANQRLNFSIKLLSSAIREDYDLEFLLFPVTAEDDPNEYPGIPLGTWRIPEVAEGEKAYWVELAIPETLQPGSWEISAHEYPNGEEFFPGPSDPPLVLVVEAAPELPVLDVSAFEVTQAALLVDPDSTVDPGAPTLYRDAPFAANLELVAQNYGATQVPVTAQLLMGGVPVPLRIWDPAQALWVETLVVDALEADAPRGIFLELAMTEPDAARIRPDLGAEPNDAQVVVTVNGDGSVPEAECVVDDPDAPLNCRHAALAATLVYAAPPAAPAQQAGLFAMSVAAPSAAPLRYEKSWSKTIGNDWVRTGIAFSAFAQLSKDGYEASARGNVPTRLLGLVEFQFVDATASASALVNGVTSVGVLVKAVGLNVYDRSYTGNPAQWELGKEFPFVQKEKAFEKTVIVYVVPVTFKLGASGELGLRGNLSASFVPGIADVAALTLSGGPYAKADAFGEGAVGLAFLSAGARVTLTLIDASLTAAATGTLTLTKRLDGRPLEIAGGLSERLSYETSFLNGRVGLVVTYPTLKWCKVWRFRFPCGFRTESKEAVLCSWPGYSYGGDLLNLSQDLFTIDVCNPTASCGGRCGTIDNGCRDEVCTCPAGEACNTSGMCAPVTFAYPGIYDVSHRWGGSGGTWWYSTGDSRARDLEVTARGEVFRGGARVQNPTVTPFTVSWSMTDGNDTNADVTFLDGSTNAYIWGPAGQTGRLFEGWIQFPGEGPLDYRGVLVPNVFRSGSVTLSSDFDFTATDWFAIEQTDLDAPPPAPVDAWVIESNDWGGPPILAYDWKSFVTGGVPGAWTPDLGMADVYLRDSQFDCPRYFLGFQTSAERRPGAGPLAFEDVTRDELASAAPFLPGYFRGGPEVVLDYAAGDVFLFETADSDAPGSPTRLGKLYVRSTRAGSNWWTNDCWASVDLQFVIYSPRSDGVP